MVEHVRKVSLYFRRADTYWRINEPNSELAVNIRPLGRYPLDWTPRLTSGHLTHFDSAGLPIRPDPYGRGFVHLLGTICCFALAHCDRYLLTDSDHHRQAMLRAVDYLLMVGDRPSHNALSLRSEHPGQGHVGTLSALTQGQAISAFCRAWLITKDTRYLDAAKACLAPLRIPVEEGGVLGRIQRLGLPWYEEWIRQPLNHCLNGMMSTLLGLHDLVVVSDHTEARELFHVGVESLIKALPAFDHGFWSRYWLPESGPHYVASMGYHNLHICLLTILAREAERQELQHWADRFAVYARSPLCRLRAAASICAAKARGLHRINWYTHNGTSYQPVG